MWPEQTKVIGHPNDFKDGVRILMRMHRNKDGGDMIERPVKKFVSRNDYEFGKRLDELLYDLNQGERIYATAERRDVDKAIRLFKQRQLDMDYSDLDSKHSFYNDVWNRWISCLQSPEASAENLFLIDCDTPQEAHQVQEEVLKLQLDFVYDYPTKHGHHYLMRPFNPSLVTFGPLIKKNAMLLVAYKS